MYLILFLFQSFTFTCSLFSPLSFLFFSILLLPPIFFHSLFLAIYFHFHFSSTPFLFFFSAYMVSLVQPSFLNVSPLLLALSFSLYLHTVYPSLSVSLDNQFYFYWKVTGKCLNFYTIVLSQSLSTRICAQLFLSFSRKSYMYHILISEVI